MLSKKIIEEVVAALNTLDTISSVLPTLSEQLDDVLANLQQINDAAQPTLATLIDLSDSALLAKQSISRLEMTSS